MTSTILSAVATSYDEFTWLDVIPGFNSLNHLISRHLGQTYWQQVPVKSVRQVFLALIMTVVAVSLAYLAGKRLRDPGRSLIPEDTLTPRNFFEILLDACMAALTDAVGPKMARRVLPLVATVAIYVLFSNLIGLIPGMAPPTENLNATLAPAIVVFCATHYFGVREHGVRGYAKHFLGPVWYIAPLYLAIEIVGHLARVMSLSFRLMGNMIGDHKVIAAFLGLTAVSFIFPVPMVALGLIVCVVQTVVFALLTVVYIQLAIAHEEH
jgi:F-type H+-transporting ATPase subunit a